MSDIVNDIKAKKQKLSSLKSETDKLIGQREQLIQSLKTDFGVENEADAEKLLVNCETELSECEADLDKINTEMDEIINKISKK
jgi:seryl-tRNA synthetase